MIVTILGNPETLSADKGPDEENNKKPKDIISLKPGPNNVHIWGPHVKHLANSIRAIVFEFGTVENHLENHESLSQSQDRENVVDRMILILID